MKRGNPMRTRFPLTSSPADVGGGTMINVTERNDGSPMTTSGMTAKRPAGPLLLLTLSLALSLLTTAAHAACHVVTPSGAGARDGSTWGNAYAGLPATLVRGDSYYIATGNYTGGYRFNTP